MKCGPLRGGPKGEYNRLLPNGEHGSQSFERSVQVQGKYVILFIFGSAIAAAVFAWSFQYLRGRRILELWGADNARLIRFEGKRVTLLTLKPHEEQSDDAARTINVDKLAFDVVAQKQISEAPGIIHARQALIEDASFQWDKPRGDCEAQWRYALEFREGNQVATVLLDMHCQRARLLENGHEAAIHPKIFTGWETFIGEHTEAESTSDQEEPTTSLD